MPQEVRYCTTDDGVRIAYSVTGAGPPLVMCPFFVESFALADQLPEYREFTSGLARGRQLLRFDARGSGLSQGDARDFSVAALASDIAAVVKAARVRQCAVYGAGLSGPRAIRFAASQPRAVTRLILYSTFMRAADVMPEGAARGFAELARANWDMAAQALVDLSGREQLSDLNVRSAKLIRESATGESVAALITQSLATDVTEALARVRARTLVIQSRETRLFRATFARDIASRIPDSELLLLSGNVNWLEPGAGAAVARAVDDFLHGRQAAATLADSSAATVPSRAGGIRAILFTDLVEHTEMMQRLGDDAGRGVLREHERITRDALTRYGGDEVKSMGDGFMASFASVTAAVECAIALQRAFAARNAAGDEPIAVRVGLNAGEPIAEDDDLFGSAVIMASRIAGEASSGEILVSEAVRHLVAGKGFVLDERGTFTAKGFDGAAGVFSVRWREQA